MFEDGRYVGPLAVVHDLRACGVLRFVEEQACDEAFSCGEAPDHEVAGAGGELGVVLCGRGGD